MVIRSEIRDAVADCEAICFPAGSKAGTRCFRVDQGRFYRWDGKRWEQLQVPVGKLWFDPRTKLMMVRQKSGWKSLLEVGAVMQKQAA